MIYVYAIGDGVSRARVVGLDGRAVERVTEGRLTAFVTRDMERPPEPTPATLGAHDEVVMSLMVDGAVLPMRFGTVLRDDADIRAVVRDRADELVQALDRVRGRVELGVRAVWRGNHAEPPAASGGDFLRAKLRRRAAARMVAAEVHPRLAQLATDARCSLLPRDDTPLAAAYLVDRVRCGEFEAHAAELAEEQPDAELVVSGPWPPYSFSEPTDA